jgi:arabinose-5-phosphate isomerase
MTFVINPQQQMIGILTDGDVRRALSQYDQPKAIPLPDIMTKSPKTIEADALAVRALRLMEEHRIMVLGILDETGKPVGALHMHDILKTGIT